MIALSLILGKIKLFSMPFGGSVTLGQYVPIIFLSYKYGVKTSFLASFIYSILHFFLSFKIIPAKSFMDFCVLIVLDYILPCVVLSFSSAFTIKKYENTFNKIYMGVILSFMIRIMIATFSGVVLWAEYIPFKKIIFLYSFIYNSIYLSLECLISILIIKKIKIFV